MLHVRVAAIICLLAASETAPAQADELVERVVAAFRQRQQRLSRARFEAAAEVLTPKGSNGASAKDGKPLPPKDVVNQRKTLLEIDQQQSVFRAEIEFPIWNEDLERFRPQFEIVCYDGKSFKRATPPEANRSEVYQPGPIQPQMTIWTDGTVRKDVSISMPWDRPMFFAVGCVIPKGWLDQTKTWPRLEPQVEMFRTVETRTVDGREIATLRWSGRAGTHTLHEDFHVDCTRGYSVIKYESAIDGQPRFVLNVDYEQRGDEWLPVGWKSTSMLEGRVPSEATFKLIKHEFVAEFSPGRFVLTPKPRAVVIKDRQFHEVDDNGVLRPTTMRELSRRKLLP